MEASVYDQRSARNPGQLENQNVPARRWRLGLGVLAAYLYARASEEHGAVEPNRLKTMDVLKLAVAVLAIVRQITDLGAGDSKN